MRTVLHTVVEAVVDATVRLVVSTAKAATVNSKVAWRRRIPIQRRCKAEASLSGSST